MTRLLPSIVLATLLLPLPGYAQEDFPIAPGSGLPPQEAAAKSPKKDAEPS